MPFTFKLSRRLAARPAVMLAAALVVACEFQRAAEPTPVATRVEVLPVAVAVQPDQTVSFTAVAFSQADDTIDAAVIWSATGGSITPMANSGGRHVVQYRSAVCGQYKVVAAAQLGGKADTANATVTCVGPPPVPVASVGVTPAAASVDEGGTVQLTATPKDAAGTVLSGRVVAWTSNNTATAMVSGSGLVTGKAAGSATVTATSEGQSGTSAITIVRVPVASVSVAPVAASVQAASTVQLTATPKDASGVPLSGRTTTWVSGNTAIATVNGSGLVSGVAAGVVTISATSEGQTGSGTVTVASGSGGSPVFVGAGDIANCGRTGDEATAALLDAIPGTVFTAGDNAYVDGTAAEYANCYDPSWGRHKARTRPTPGNHEYNTPGGAGYYAYFGAAAGEPGKGYYAFDLGEWRILMLNSQVDVSAGSLQEQWLRADLAANPHQCTLAVFHYPYFTSGTRGRRTEMRAVWQALYDAGADVVISGHDHLYERFAPQTPAGAGDPDRGIRQFTAGMGGSGLYEFGTTTPNSEVRNNTAYGVLKLTLHPTSYAWEFVPVAGQTFSDRGGASCH